MRRKVAFGAALLTLVVAGLAAGFYLRATDRPESGLDTELKGISVSTADPSTLEETTETAPTTTGKKAPARPAERCWPNFGADPQRSLAREDIRLGRPTRPLWARAMGDTMEYPPSFCDGRLYVNLQKEGRTIALDARTREILWTWKADGFMASTPAIAGPRLIVSSHAGTVTALNRANGRPLWEIRTRGKVESSPVVLDNTVYFGSTDGRLFAVDVRTGKVRWAFDTGGRINASPSIYGARICITTYAGSIFCLRRSNGREFWRTYIKRDLVRYESFYASPSTDGRRIYTTARTGKVVALSASSGRVIWTRHMHALAYATPAIAHGRIYVGAFDGRFRAFRATNGDLLWTRSLGGRIGGHAFVAGNIVFVATLEGRTYGLRASDGKTLWHVRGGEYSPGIATDRFYYFSLNGLLVAFRGEHSPRA